MLGDHEGLTPPSDLESLASPALKALGRLKAGKDVAWRRKVIDRALAQIDAEDRHWMEGFASRLSGENGLDAIPAHLAALSAAWEIRENEVARIIRSVNTQGRDAFTAQAVRGISAAAPAFGKRIQAMKVNSDEVMLRVALAHLFRRDPTSEFQMFLIDGVARQLPKAMKTSISEFVRSCLERFDDEPTPEGVWGFLLVLMETHGRSGYFIYPPSDDDRRELAVMRSKLEEALGKDLSADQFAHHIAGAAYSRYLRRGDVESFASMMGAMMSDLKQPFLVLYAREEEQGVYRRLLQIPAESADEARRKVGKMPEVAIHDQFRTLNEFYAQMDDDDSEVKH